MLLNDLVVGMVAILVASVRMHKQPFAGPFVLDCHVKRTTDQICSHAFIDSIADQLSGI